MRKIHERHGESKSRIYKIWRGILDRCLYESHANYLLYGGRGISICDEWRNSFIAFSSWAKANGYKSDKSIDRINPDGNYCPENCRWATNKQQARNRRPEVAGKLIEHNGEILNISQWSRKLNINYTTLIKRFNKGLRGEELFCQTRIYRDALVSAVVETRNGKSKLTADQIIEIKGSTLSGADLSKLYKVSQSTISMIKSGKRR